MELPMGTLRTISLLDIASAANRREAVLHCLFDVNQSQTTRQSVYDSSPVLSPDGARLRRYASWLLMASFFAHWTLVFTTNAV